jgi:hypothetical protein
MLFVALVPATLAAGTYVAVVAVVDPALRRCSGSIYIATRQALGGYAARYGRTLMVATVTTAAIAVVVAARGGDAAPAALAAGGLASAAIVMGVSVFLELPISAAIAAWHPDEPPDGWRAARERLGRLNVVRGCAALTTVALLGGAAGVC